MTDYKKWIEEQRRMFGVCESRGFADPHHTDHDVPGHLFTRALDHIDSLLRDNDALRKERESMWNEAIERAAITVGASRTPWASTHAKQIRALKREVK